MGAKRSHGMKTRTKILSRINLEKTKGRPGGAHSVLILSLVYALTLPQHKLHVSHPLPSRRGQAARRLSLGPGRRLHAQPRWTSRSRFSLPPETTAWADSRRPTLVHYSHHAARLPHEDRTRLRRPPR